MSLAIKIAYMLVFYAVYRLVGFELVVVMGLAMLVAGIDMRDKE